MRGFAGGSSFCGVLLLWGLACAPTEPPEVPFELRGFRQAQADVVALNEELVFHFSSDLDRASVTRETVRITDREGAPVAGEFLVRGSLLTFRPTLPKLSDLRDGGLQPGMLYMVELIGFPRPDGLRAEDGSVLRTSYESRFRTVAVEGAAPLFADPFFAEPSFLAPKKRRLGPLDPIELVYGEALDPTTLKSEDFVLFSYTDEEQIPLRLELVQNERTGAVLWVRAFSQDVSPGGLRALTEGKYFLRFKRDAHLKTLGGRPVSKRWGPRPLELFVIEPKPETEVWDFDETTDRGREVVPGVDGTAVWPGNGSVSIRFPREAGTGTDGRVSSWPRGEDPTDLHASRLIVPPASTWDLSEREGLVVLRSQGPFEVAGVLQRRVREGTKAIAESLRGPDRRFLADAGSLASWLEEARERGEDWTVLIAGGDLRVSGSIEIEGPLLMIAGGWIRVDGRLVAKEIWKSPEGGENAVAEEPVRIAPFQWQAPAENPLVESLRFAVLSNLFRPDGGVQRWGAAQVDGDGGHGRFRVRFLGLRDFGLHGPELIGPLDDPTLLSDCDAVRFLVELEVDPAEGPWSPPRVDRVALQWNVDSRPEDD